MKKLFILILTFVSLSLGAQISSNPTTFNNGIVTPKAIFPSYTTAERDAISPSATDRTIIHHKDTGIDQFEQWDGDSWEILVGGSFEGYVVNNGTVAGQDLDLLIGGSAGIYPTTLSLNQTAAFNGQSILRAGSAKISLFANPATVTIDAVNGTHVQNRLGINNGSFTGQIWSSNLTTDSDYQLPIIGVTSRVLPISVNGVFADSTGDITIATGSGDVSSTLNITDNAIVRGDGGSKNVQDSGILIDDSDNITGVSNLTATGITSNGKVTINQSVGSTALEVNSSDLGAGIVSNVTLLGTGNAFVGQNDGVNTFTVNKTGDVTANTYNGEGKDLTLDASGFNGNLTTADDTVQEIAQKLDDLVTGGSSNPNEVAVTTESQLSDVGNAGKILCVQSDITLTANLAITTNAVLKDCGGSIILNGFTLTGDNTGLLFSNNKILINVGLTGVIAGTWNPPSDFYVDNFGAISDGIEFRTPFTVDKSGAGSITASSTTLTITGGVFTSNDVGKKIVVFGADSTTDENALVTTIASFTSSSIVELTDAADTTVSNTRVFYGTDNYNMIYQALVNVRNKKSGKLSFSDGHYMTSAIKKTVLASQPQDGFIIGGGTNNIIIQGNNTILQTFPFDFVDADPSNEKRTNLFDFYRTNRSEINGMRLIGAGLSNIDFTEYPAGINLNTGAFNCRIINCDIAEFQGDGIVFDGDPQFEGGIQGINHVNPSFDTDTSVGRVLTDGTIDALQTNYRHSTDLILINGGNYDDFSEIAGYGSFMLTGSSFAGWSGLTTQDYEAAIYDDTDTFVVFLSDLTLYEEVRIQESNWKKIRVHFKDVVDPDEINLLLRCDFNSHGTYIENTNVSYCKRQGASNLTSGTWWNGGLVHNNGGVSPGYGIDVEDHRRNSRNLRFTNLTMWDNNAGDFAFIGTENVSVENCHFLASTRPNWGSTTAIGGNYCRGLQIEGCYFRQKSISIARAASVKDCHFNEGTITTASAGCKISDIQMIQGKIIVDGINTDGHNKEDANPVLENITIRMYKEFDFILSDRNVLGQWKNVKIFLNDASIVSNLVEGSSLNASLTTNQTLWAELDFTAGQPYGGGYLDGFTVTGHQLNNNKSSTTSFARFPQYEWTRNVNTDCGVTIGFYGSGAVNILWENLKCNFLDIDPRHGDYLTAVPADPIANPAPVWTFKDAKIVNKVGEFDMSDINFRMLQIEDFWIDVVFKNSFELVNEVAYAQTLNRSVYLEMDNYGKVRFENSTFGNKGSEGGTVGNDIVLNNTWFREATRTYPIEIVNPILLDGQTITTTSDDYVAFTQANDLLSTYATYADDAAAATGNYPQHYWYMTSTGELRVKL